MPLGIMEAKLNTYCKTSRVQYCCVMFEGFKGGPQLQPYDAATRHTLGMLHGTMVGEFPPNIPLYSNTGQDGA